MSEIRFVHLPPTSREHFKLCFHAAVLDVLDHVTRLFGSQETTLTEFPFLAGYQDQLANSGLEGQSIDDARLWWREAITEWEAKVAGHLPLRALKSASGLDYETLTLLFTIGLIEEDARFGILFDALQGGRGQHRPMAGLLCSWAAPEQDRRAGLRNLQQLGLIQPVNPEAPWLDQALAVPLPLWDAIRGEIYETITPWARFQPAEQLFPQEELVVSETARHILETLPALLASGDVQTVIVRGPHHNGRHTILEVLARLLGRGVLAIDTMQPPNAELWRIAGPLTTLLHAVPVVAFDLAPGETIELSGMLGTDGPLGIVLGKTGAVLGAAVERSVTITLDLPDPILRHKQWSKVARSHPFRVVDFVADRLRLTSGNIYRVAKLAHAQALLAEHSEIEMQDIQKARQALASRSLESLAARLDVTGDWGCLALAEETQQDLWDLEVRCCKRERLITAAGPLLKSQVNTGVRALFSGPSGTGKTLAACLLASQLQMEIYRLDLSAVVNKYIGETEKNLNQVFSNAEELDVILLIDEGDALLTQRTSVNTSNDRYANLETNFLLQRLETFSGIVIVTTNSSEHIDSAFQRRMDVTIQFRSPDVTERWQIWQLHLPESSSIDPHFMSEVVARCLLTGGQIRNAALHATLLALNNGGVVTDFHLESAIQREYRKLGAVCPLRISSGNRVVHA